MEHLTGISGTNVKGRNFSHALTPLVMISGPNFTGKSTIADAVRLLLGGYLPELGKRNEDTLEFCTGSTMAVEGVLSSGHVLSRTWNRTGDGTEQKKNLPKGFEWNIPLMDPADYFSLTDSEQIDYIFERAAMPDGYDVERFCVEIDKINADSEDVTSHDEEAVEAVKGWLREELMKADNLPSGLIRFLADKGKLKSEYSHWNRRKKDTIGAVRTLNELNATAAEFSEENLNGIAGQIEAAQKELTRISELLGEKKALRRLAEQQAERRQKLRSEFEDLNGIDHCGAVEELNRQTGEHRARLVPFNEAEFQTLTQKFQEKRDELIGLQRDLKQYERDISVLTTERQEAESIDHCDKCKCSGKTFEKLRANLIKEIDTQLTEAEISHRNAACSIEEANGYLESMGKQLETLKTRQSDNASIEKQLKAIEEEISHARDNQTRDRKRMDDIEAELSTMRVAGPVSPAEIEALEQEQEQAELTFEGLQEKQQALHDRAKGLRDAKNALHEHQQAASFEKMIKLAGQRIKDVQAEMVEKVFGEICSRANHIAGDLLPSPLEFRNGQVGRAHGMHFITHRAFSGTEKALTYLAVAAALSSQRDLRILVLDEMGRLTGQLQGAVLRRFTEAVNRGWLDQVVCVIPKDKPVEVPGWTNITLS